MKSTFIMMMWALATLGFAVDSLIARSEAETSRIRAEEAEQTVIELRREVEEAHEWVQIVEDEIEMMMERPR